MQRSLIVATLALTFAAFPALAEKPKDSKGGSPAITECAPGLAKKDPACVPPGQAKKVEKKDKKKPGKAKSEKEHKKKVKKKKPVPDYKVGHKIEAKHAVVGNPRKYGLDPAQTYWRVGDQFFRVNKETGEVLEILGAIKKLTD